jgi:assimilatory nitrate reductase catalytic subunit
MLAEVGRRMGWEAAFAFRNPAEIFCEHAALSAFENEGASSRVFDIGALCELNDEEYEHLSPVYWPLPRGTLEPWSSTKRLFGDGRGFTTPDGRARFVPTTYRPPGVCTDVEWPLLLNTGRVRDQWHTMTRTGRVPRLMAHQSEPILNVHPTDAMRLHLKDGGLARVESPHGATVLPVGVSDGLREGEVFAPIHWTDEYTSAGPIGKIVGAATDPISGQPELKATPVRITAITPRWYGLLLRGSETAPDCSYYWARVPLEKGHAFTLVGWEPLPSGFDSELWISALLDAPAAAELVIYADPARGNFRYAHVSENRLHSCLFITRSKSSLPSRDALAALLGTPMIERETRTSVLAGGRASSATQSAGGQTICACFGVGLNTLHRAIVSHRLISVADIGANLRAGTNCGSCIPELKAILSRAHSEVEHPMLTGGAE